MPRGDRARGKEGTGAAQERDLGSATRGRRVLVTVQPEAVVGTDMRRCGTSRKREQTPLGGHGGRDQAENPGWPRGRAARQRKGTLPRLRDARGRRPEHGSWSLPRDHPAPRPAHMRVEFSSRTGATGGPGSSAGGPPVHLKAGAGGPHCDFPSFPGRSCHPRWPFSPERL